MKIELKPFVCFAPDYHNFSFYIDLFFNAYGVQFAYEELGWFQEARNYLAIFWVEGEEDKLFEALFCDELIYENLMALYAENEEYEN